MLTDRVMVRVPNWSKFNPRADRANYTWFRLENNFFHDESVFPLTANQRMLFLFIACQCSKKNADTIELVLEYASVILKESLEALATDLQALNSTGLIIITKAVKKPSKRRSEAVAAPSSLPATKHNKTDITNNTNEQARPRESVFDFESLYQAYPRKIGKTPGIKKAQQGVKSQADYDALAKAIAHFTAHHVREKTELRFIPYFSTFMTSWRDWINPPQAPPSAPVTDPRKAELDAEWQEILRQTAEAEAKANGNGVDHA